MTNARVRFFLVLCATSLLTMPPLMARGEGGTEGARPLGQPAQGILDPSFNTTLKGGVTAAGVGLRGSGTGSISVSGIPAGATVEQALLYWATIGTNGIYTSPTLAGVPVAGQLLATAADTCWNANNNFVYRADVTSIVTGNGSYNLAGLPSSSPLTDDSQGASLVVIYAEASSPAKTVVVNDGAVVMNTANDSYTDTLIGFTSDDPVTAAQVTYIVGDGQIFTDGPLLFNGTTIADNVFGGTDGSFWDTLTYDVTDQVAPTAPATSATTTINNEGDCLVWAATVFSVTTEEAGDFVVRDGDSFSLRGEPYRFIGVNLRGIAYVYEDPAVRDAEITEQLRSAGKMGAKVARVFIAKNDRLNQQIVDALWNLINISQDADLLSDIRGELGDDGFEFRFLVSLTDFYNDSPFHPGGDGPAFDRTTPSGEVLNYDWFKQDPGGEWLNYKDHYKPLVGELVDEFSDEPAIFAWELGNELQAENAGDILAFAYDMASYIKDNGARQMVTNGLIGVNHASCGQATDGWVDGAGDPVAQPDDCGTRSGTPVNPRDIGTVISEMYGSWNGTPSPIDFGSIHAYNNEQEPDPNKNPYWYNPQQTQLDIGWFLSNGFPYVVGEGGFDGAGSQGNTSCIQGPGFVGYLPDDPNPNDDTFWGDVHIPGTLEYRTRRITQGNKVSYEGAIPATVDEFLDQRSADGYMQWGFMHLTGFNAGDNGQGDRCNGMDELFHSDWTDLYAYYLNRGRSLGITPESLLGEVAAGLEAIIAANPGTPLARELSRVLRNVEQALAALSRQQTRQALMKIDNALADLTQLVASGQLDPALGQPLIDLLTQAAEALGP